MPRAIRLGVLNVDNHLYHFLPVLAKLDLRRFREVTPECHYWFTDCYRPFEVVPKFVTGFKVTRLWDADPVLAQEGITVFADPPEIDAPTLQTPG